jgi:hypothetical protein
MSRAGLVGLVLVVVGCGAPATPNAAADHERREAVVDLVASGELAERDEDGRVVLPNKYSDLSQAGVIDVRDDPLMVFFTTWVGFGPDPYCGYEYSPEADAVVVDPRGSGTGEAEPLGDGWYWICAS